MLKQQQIEELVEIMQLKYKNHSTINHMITLLQPLRFFKDKQQLFNRSLYSQVIQKLSLQCCNKGDVVFHYGQSDIELFYIIFKGSVAILCPKDPQTTHQQVIQEYEHGHYSSKCININTSLKHRGSEISQSAFNELMKAQAYAKFLGINIQKLDQATLLEEYEKSSSQTKQHTDEWLQGQLKVYFPSLQVVNNCIVGDTFGEIALIGKQGRTATVVCTEDCYLLTLTNSDFQNILESFQTQVQGEKIDALKHLMAFKGLPKKRVRQIIETLTVSKYALYSVIYLENTAPTHFYYIKSGQVELQSIINKKQLPISLLQAGCEFGYDDIAKEQTRQFRAVSKSIDCELYLIPKSALSESAQPQQTTEQAYFKLRLHKLLSAKHIPKKEQTKSKDDVKNYKEFFQETYDSITRISTAKLRVSKQHKKLLSQPYSPMFNFEQFKKDQLTELKEKREKRQSELAKSCSSRMASAHTYSTNKLVTNIHSHLFTPRCSKKNLEVHRPFRHFKTLSSQLQLSSQHQYQINEII